MRTAQPIFLLYLLSYFSPNSLVSKQEAYVYATGITMTALISVIIHQHYFFDVRRMGMQLRVAVIGLIYRKVIVIVTVPDTALNIFKKYIEFVDK